MSGERYSGTIEPFEYNHFNTLEFNKILPQKNVKLFHIYALSHWIYWEPPHMLGYSYFHKRLQFFSYVNFFFMKPKFMRDVKFVFTIYDMRGLV